MVCALPALDSTKQNRKPETQHSLAQQSLTQHKQHSTAQHSTAQHSTAQHSTAQRSIAQQPVVECFLRAGETHPGAALQDILRLLTLWFNHGSAPDVEAALQEGFGHVSIDTWLAVIPQVSLCCSMLLLAMLRCVCYVCLL